MRVTALTAGFLLTSAIVSISGLTIQPAMAHQARVTCLCDCPDDHKVRRHAEVRPVMPAPRRMVRRVVRHYAEGGYYSYGAAAPVYYRQWHGAWRVAPNDANIPGPAMAYYGPPPGYYDQGVHIDDRGWGGGVGYGGEGGGGGGGGDYGQIHLSNGGSAENGPTYNDYNQSFQFNPSQAEPFRNRLMGGFAPPAKK